MEIKDIELNAVVESRGEIYVDEESHLQIAKKNDSVHQLSVFLEHEEMSVTIFLTDEVKEFLKEAIE